VPLSDVTVVLIVTVCDLGEEPYLVVGLPQVVAADDGGPAGLLGEPAQALLLHLQFALEAARAHGSIARTEEVLDGDVVDASESGPIDPVDTHVRPHRCVDRLLRRAEQHVRRPVRLIRLVREGHHGIVDALAHQENRLPPAVDSRKPVRDVTQKPQRGLRVRRAVEILGVARLGAVRRDSILVAYRGRRRQPVAARQAHRRQEPALAVGEFLVGPVSPGGVHHGHQIVCAEPLDELRRRRPGTLDAHRSSVQVVEHQYVYAPLAEVLIRDDVGSDTWKSFFVRSRTNCPCGLMTTTSTSTYSTPLLKVGGCGTPSCGGSVAVGAATTNRASSQRSVRNGLGGNPDALRAVAFIWPSEASSLTPAPRLGAPPEKCRCAERKEEIAFHSAGVAEEFTVARSSSSLPLGACPARP
jgi:hypothetical protein